MKLTDRSILVLVLSFALKVHGFTGHSATIRPISVWRNNPTVIRANRVGLAANADDTDDESINGSQSSSAAAVVLQSQGTSKLASAFSALAENDQYDAVLTGLCAKILDDETSQEKIQSVLQDPVSLLREMNDRNVAASGRSLMSLIDATVQTQDVNSMAGILSLSLQNGGLTKYGALQNDIIPLPSSGSSRVQLVDGSRKTRDERLSDLPDVPVDDRGAEVSSALLASSVVGFCTACNVLGFDDITVFTNIVLTFIIGVGVVDNFYDVIQFGVSLLPIKQDSVKLPEKNSLPLGLGSGDLTGTVVRGLTRLLSVDTERECECEAAAFFAAYTLGLPCFAFRPNALEAAVLVVESMKPKESDTSNNSSLDPLLSDVGMMKLLVWLLAPVAMESSKHAQLIVSDPRESAGLLQRLEERAELLQDDLMWWIGDEEERTDMLKWAYAEADLLLRSHKATVTELTERLAGGAATVGDCVAVMEDW